MGHLDGPTEHTGNRPHPRGCQAHGQTGAEAAAAARGDRAPVWYGCDSCDGVGRVWAQRGATRRDAKPLCVLVGPGEVAEAQLGEQ